MPKMSSNLSLLTILLFAGSAPAASYQYIRLGDKADSTAIPNAGTAMMGGGKDLDEAFRWLCKKANGGDFLVLRARGDDDYNAYVNGMCKLNSVATLIIPDTAAAQDPAVANIIRHAEAVFIAAGNQARYVEFWKGTPVQDPLTHMSPAASPSAAPVRERFSLQLSGEFFRGRLRRFAPYTGGRQGRLVVSALDTADLSPGIPGLFPFRGDFSSCFPQNFHRMEKGQKRKAIG